MCVMTYLKEYFQTENPLLGVQITCSATFPPPSALYAVDSSFLLVEELIILCKNLSSLLCRHTLILVDLPIFLIVAISREHFLYELEKPRAPLRRFWSLESLWHTSAEKCLLCFPHNGRFATRPPFCCIFWPGTFF